MMAVASDTLNIYDVGDEMGARGWHLDRQQFPPSLHMTLSPFHLQVVEPFLADLARGHSEDPIARALVDTAMRFAIPHEHFADFLTSMRMDLTVTEYPTFADLAVYVHGSAAVIGREMVHVLGATDPAKPKHAPTTRQPTSPESRGSRFPERNMTSLPQRCQQETAHENSTHGSTPCA